MCSEQLKCLVEGQAIPVAPSFEEGLILVDFSNPNFTTKGQAISNAQGPVQEKADDKDNAVDKVKNFFIGAYEKTSQVTKDVIKKTEQKVSETEIKKDIKEFGTKVGNKTA